MGDGFRWAMGKQACTHACDATKGGFNRRYIEKWATFKWDHRLPLGDGDDDYDVIFFKFKVDQ